MLSCTDAFDYYHRITDLQSTVIIFNNNCIMLQKKGDISLTCQSMPAVKGYQDKMKRI